MKLNKFNTASYIIIFTVFALGAFFRIYNNSLFKIAVPVIIGVLGLYYYVNNDISKYLKLGILVLFLGHNANQYFFIVLTILLFNTKILLPAKGPVKYLYLMMFAGGLSYVLNQFIEINLLAFPFFIASFFFPLAIFSIAYRYVDGIIKTELIEYYIKIVFLLSISAIIQYIALGVTVDKMTGGTTNAHTLGFHMAVAFVFIVSKILTGQNIKTLSFYEWILFFLIFPIMYLADAKYLMGNMIIACGVIYILFHTNKILKPLLVTLSALILLFSVEVIKTANISMSVKADVDVSVIVYRFTDSAKYQLYEKTILLPFNEPLVFLIGSGPGTFLSRAANSRAFDTMNKRASAGAGEGVEIDSKLPAFIPAHTSWITKKYAVQYFYQSWFGTLFDYRSSIISLFWEFGIFGFSLFLIFFGKVIAIMNRMKSTYSQLKPDAFFIQAFIVFYFLNALIAYYFEYPEMQILLWMLIGMFCNRKLVSE